MIDFGPKIFSIRGIWRLIWRLMTSFFKKLFFEWLDFWILGIRFKRIKNDWLWLKNFFDPRIGALSRSNVASVTSLFKKLFFEWFDFWILGIRLKRVENDWLWLKNVSDRNKMATWRCVKKKLQMCTFNSSFIWLCENLQV